MGDDLSLSTSNHPQSNGQMDNTIQTIEDMLWACIFGSRGSWKHHLPLIEFVYNNNYHSSIRITPYEAMHEGKCITPLWWAKVRDARKLSSYV